MLQSLVVIFCIFKTDNQSFSPDSLLKLLPLLQMETLQTSKQLSYSLIHGCYEIIQLRNVVVRLMKQCEQISGQMELVVSKLTGGLGGPRDEEDHITTQPKLLTSESVLMLVLLPMQIDTSILPGDGP